MQAIVGKKVPPLHRLWRFFEAQRDGWSAANAAFERRDLAVVDGTQWTIICKIHAIRSPNVRMDKFKFRASITVWPGTTTKGASEAGLPGMRWRRQFGRKIRQQGYRGRWRRFPGGLFGDFWKTLTDASAVRAEVKRLDKLCL